MLLILLTNSVLAMENDQDTKIANINEDQNALEGYFSSLFDSMSGANITRKPSTYISFFGDKSSEINKTITTKHMKAHLYVGKLLTPHSAALDAKFAELRNELQDNEQVWQSLKKHFLDNILRPAFNEYKKITN